MVRVWIELNREFPLLQVGGWPSVPVKTCIVLRANTWLPGIGNGDKAAYLLPVSSLEHSLSFRFSSWGQRALYKLGEEGLGSRLPTIVQMTCNRERMFS